jgi:acyl-CoA thioester hydrolase
MKTYQKTITVDSGDLDDLDHVNNVRYLEWVQDVSREHWERLSTADWNDKFVWVVRSHHITYHRPALIGQDVLLTTFVPYAEGAISRRKVEMKLSEGGTPIAECLTEWVLLDARTGRPARMPIEMIQVFG